jgi:hypothetical protein
LNNILSDSNISDNTAERDDLYKQFLPDTSTGSIDFQPFVEDKEDDILLKTSNDKQSVAGKVKGATISQSSIESNNIKDEDNDGDSVHIGSSKEANKEYGPQITDKDINLDTSSIDPVEDLVREWQRDNNRKELSTTFRNIALQTATINIMHQRGITVSDLVDNGIGKDYAEKLLPQAVDYGLLIRLDNRFGKQYQYVLSNYVYNLNPKDADVENDDEILPSDVSLILARELSGMEYAYHNIHLITTLNYKEDYHALNWDVPSKVNQQKVKSFNLEPKRSVNFRVSPSGTVNISIECTYRPFEFHTAAGLMNFFGICGKIDTYLQLSTKNRINVVPWFGNWSLIQFDYNKDLPTKALKDKYHSKVINWSSKGVLRIYYLGIIFRIYCKMMPYIGEFLRLESRFSTKEKMKMIDSLPGIAVSGFDNGSYNNDFTDDNSKPDKKHPFTTIEEMLLNRRIECEGVMVTKNKSWEEEL